MATNKNATLRYRTIDNLLCSDEWHTIEDLKHACEEALFNENGSSSTLSRVTIYNDLDFLRGLEGVVIEHQPGKPARYRYARESRTFNGTMVPSQSYTDLAYTLECLESVSGLVSVDGTIRRLRRQLDSEGKGMQKLMSFQANQRLRNSDMLWTLYRHIREENPLKMRYNASYMEVKEVEFQPWYLKQYSNRWFLLGWAYRIADSQGERVDVGLRNFAIDRIEPSEEGRPRIDIARKRSGKLCLNTPEAEWHVDFDEYFSDIIGVTRYDSVEPVEVVLHASLSDQHGRYDWNRMVTKPLHPSQRHWTDGDDAYVSIVVRPNNELYSTLLGYGSLEVVSPETVRCEMRARIESLLSHYVKTPQR